MLEGSVIGVPDEKLGDEYELCAFFLINYVHIEEPEEIGHYVLLFPINLLPQTSMRISSGEAPKAFVVKKPGHQVRVGLFWME